MKYINTSLRNNRICSPYGLVKYKATYSDILDICNLSNNMVNDIKNLSNNDINSDTKSYMINYYNRRCLGGVLIEQDRNDKDRISVRIELDETKFGSVEAMEELEEILMDSFKIYFYDKECIDFQFSERNKNVICGFSHIYDNRIINTCITRLINEIKKTEKILLDWNLNWYRDCIKREIYKGVYVDLLDSDYDKEIINKIDNGTISLEEVFYKLNKIKFSSIVSKNNEREITFDINGDVSLIKKSKKKNRELYQFNYNVMKPGFEFKKDNEISVSDNNILTEYEVNDVKVIEYKDSRKKHYTYVSPVIDNSSIKIDLIIDRNNSIEKCYIDFRTHKNGNNKVNGTYALRIIQEDEYFKLSFISRRGKKNSIMRAYPYNRTNELYYEILNRELTPDLLDELINKILVVINNKVNSYNDKGYDKKKVNYTNYGIMSHIFSADKYAFDYLRQIKGELPLQHLSRVVNNFVKEKDVVTNKKSNGKVKQIRRTYEKRNS